MAEFIFDLQRFDSSGAGGPGGGGSSSGGSNAKTDGNSSSSAAAVETWSDHFAVDEYSSSERRDFRLAARTEQVYTTPAEYTGTAYPEVIGVSGYENNIIYNVDRFDSVNFVDLNLASLANYTEGSNSIGNYVDLLFNTGTITRLYTEDDFTPGLNFMSGLSEIYSPTLDTWFTPQDLNSASIFWSNYNRYVASDDLFDAEGNVYAVSEVAVATAGVNNIVVNAGVEDSVYIDDASWRNLTDAKEVSDGLLALSFDNGTITFIDYTDTFSPEVRLAGQSIYYNSKSGAWRTPAEALADAEQYAADEAAAAAEKAAYEANFTAVYDADSKSDPTYPGSSDDEDEFAREIPASRWYSTLVYNSESYDDIYFNDAYSANLASVYMDDDYHINLLFDTGALTRVEYYSIVTPIFHFADGEASAYNWATGAFCDAYSGATRLYEYSDGSHSTQYGENDIFTISRAKNSFVNKVNYEDDIYFYDATAANISDLSVIGGYAISFTFDTGANTRVQDVSYISPVFHFSDGTAMAYNWFTDQWAGAVTATEDVAEGFSVSAWNNNFIREPEVQDAIYITDATAADIAEIRVSGRYINLYFDTGASTAVRFEGYYSPSFVFSDGSAYTYNWIEDAWQTTADAAAYMNNMAESDDLWGDPVDADILGGGAVAADATLSDLVAAPVNNAAVSFNADSAFDINAAGGFVAANTAANSEQKEA